MDNSDTGSQSERDKKAKNLGINALNKSRADNLGICIPDADKDRKADNLGKNRQPERDK